LPGGLAGRGAPEPGVAIEDRAGLRRGQTQLGGGHRVVLFARHGKEVAIPVSLSLRLKGLADEHCSGVPRTVSNVDVEAVIVETLTEKRATPPTGRREAWPAPWYVPADGEPDLEGVRAQTVAGGDLQAFRGRSLCRQGSTSWRCS